MPVIPQLLDVKVEILEPKPKPEIICILVMQNTEECEITPRGVISGPGTPPTSANTKTSPQDSYTETQLAPCILK